MGNLAKVMMSLEWNLRSFHPLLLYVVTLFAFHCMLTLRTMCTSSVGGRVYKICLLFSLFPVFCICYCLLFLYYVLVFMFIYVFCLCLVVCRFCLFFVSVCFFVYFFVSICCFCFFVVVCFLFCCICFVVLLFLHIEKLRKLLNLGTFSYFSWDF